MRRSFRGPRVIVPKANEKVAFGASPKLTNFRLYLLSHEELLTQDSGLILIPFILSPFSFLMPVINCAEKAQRDDIFLPCLCFCSFSRKNFSQCALDWDFCQDFYGLMSNKN